MIRYYAQSEDIALFQDSITLPGVARRLLCRAAAANGAHFAVLDKSTEDIHSMFRRNIAGGASSVYTRYAEKDKTYIKDGAEIVRKIIGIDSNAMYLKMLELSAPCGYVTVRRESDGFKKWCKTGI